ncbi:MAG: hypothetical protein ACHQM4_11145 [Thermoanaerobaculia bacterium]
MKSSPEARVRLVTRAILAIGFASAVVIYFVNAAPPDASGFEFENSKKYLRELEVYGGKANVLATEFRHWFDGLWHGRSLAFTVAVISAFLALAYNFFATPLPQADDGDDGRERNEHGSKP